MSRVTYTTTAPPQSVWAGLADGWTYPVWVVGAARMRGVDDAWPHVGARIYHSVGLWPLMVEDYSEVIEVEPEQRLRLRLRLWPFGEAQVMLRLVAQGGGTKVSMEERVTRGPGRLLPKPLVDLSFWLRNRESLRRLCFIAEGRVFEHSHAVAAEETNTDRE